MRKYVKQIIPNIVSGALIILPLVTTLYVFFFLFQKADSALPYLFHTLIPSLPEEWIPG
ncbi:MAG: hypothetical protein GF401_15545, partial [Chitinivibrionales bacterium]|nr:hypothetical protein [Chitinivibrionales bacterium]